MKGVCYVIGASDAKDIYIDMSQNHYIIAADGGYSYLEAQNIKADLVVGDFDSLDRIPKHENIIRHQPEKDDTDLLIAVKEGLSLGYRTFVIYGGLGGRLDHTYGNLQVLVYIAEHGGRGYLLGEAKSTTTETTATIVTAVKNTTISFHEKHSGIISVFSAASSVKGVYLKGLKYELTDAVLTNTVPLGVSNEFIGMQSEITVKDGILLVMWNHDIQDTISRISSHISM